MRGGPGDAGDAGDAARFEHGRGVAAERRGKTKVGAGSATKTTRTPVTGRGSRGRTAPGRGNKVMGVASGRQGGDRMARWAGRGFAQRSGRGQADRRGIFVRKKQIGAPAAARLERGADWARAWKGRAARAGLAWRARRCGSGVSGCTYGERYCSAQPGGAARRHSAARAQLAGWGVRSASEGGGEGGTAA